jgi:hypothetical protein
MDTLTAFHEAGHATVSLLYGEMPDTVTIRPDDDSAGHTALLGVEARAILKAAVRGRTPEDRDRVTRYLVGVAAGPAAQAFFMRRGGRVNFDNANTWSLFGGSQDYNRLAFFVAGKARGLEDVTAEAVASEAQDLLEQPGIWSAVEQVAGDLLRYGELGYEEVRNAVYFNDLIGVKPLVTTKGNSRQDELRRGGWSENEIGTGRRAISHEEAERKIKAKSPFGWGRVGWNKEMERR